MHEKPYIPAATFESFARIYDPALRYLMRENRFKQPLVERASLQKGQRILDIGCGTGTLTLMLKQATSGLEVVGIDPDPKILAIAKQKSLRAGIAIEWEQAFSQSLSFRDASFDHVFSSLMLHHLTRDDKLATLREVYRVLKPGGQLHVADFGPANTAWTRLSSRLVARFEDVDDNFKGRLPGLLTEAGFVKVKQDLDVPTLFGTITLLFAEKPPFPKHHT